MARNLPKALREACTAPKRQDLVYRGAVAVRDFLRLLGSYWACSTIAGTMGGTLLPLSAVLLVGSWAVAPDTTVQALGAVFAVVAIVLLFTHSEIKRRR